MYKWRIDLILTSGKELTVYYTGDEDKSGDVAKKMLVGNVNSMNAFLNKDGTRQVIVRIGEIAVAAISAA